MNSVPRPSLSLAFALATALPVASPVQAQGMVQALPGTTDADRLADQMRALAINPTNVDALVTAGELSLKLDDLSGAASLFARADKVDPQNGRVKSGMGSILVRSERPGEALRYFAMAEGYGIDPRRIAADRGLAYDLIGQQERAQRDYRLALKTLADDETVRRYALSLGISGKRDQALTQLDPLVRKNDRGAWRARAFVLAMTGDEPGAERIATTMMPPGMAEGLQPFFVRLPGLDAADRAFAVHFGEVHATADRLADARMVPALAPLAPELGPPVVLAAVQPVEIKTKKAKKSKPGRVAIVAAAPVQVTPAPDLPPPPTYRPTTPGVALAAAQTSYPAVRPSVARIADRPLTPAESASLAAATGRMRRGPSSGELAVASRPAPALAAPMASAAVPTRAPVVAPSLTTAPAPSRTPTVRVADTASPRPSPAPVTVAPVVVPPPVTPTPSRAPAVQVAEAVTSRPLPPPVTIAPTRQEPAPVDTAPSPAFAVAPTSPPATLATAGTLLAPVTSSPVTSSPVASAPAAPAPRPQLTREPAYAAVAPVPPKALAHDGDAILARIIAGLSIPAAELDVAAPPPHVVRPAPAPVTAAHVVTEAKAKEARDSAAGKLLATTAAADAKAADRKTIAGRKSATEKAPALDKKTPIDRKALAAKKAADDKKIADAKAAAEEKKALRADPARTWVQVAGGANEDDLPKAWAAVRTKAPALFAGKQAWTTPLRATNRVLAGPFKTDAEARAYVNQLTKAGVSAFTFSSDPGQKVTRLPVK